MRRATLIAIALPLALCVATAQAHEEGGGISKVNGGTFMWCHQGVFAATGIWVDELVPVFQKLDAILITRAAGPQ